MDQYRDKVVKWMGACKAEGSFFVFDTETTGLSPKECDIIEFSALKVNMQGQVTEALDLFIDPGYEVPENITSLTGITKEKIKNDGISQAEATDRIISFWGEHPVIAGYNSVNFDQPFLSTLFLKTRGFLLSPAAHLDVCRMAKEKIPDKKHTLGNMAKYFKVDEGLQFHSSIDDAKATLGVMMKLLPMYREKEPDDEPFLDIRDFFITWVSHFKKSYKMDRIYIKNTANAKVYYDIPKRMWYIGGHLPEDDVLECIYKYAGVRNDADLVSKYAESA